MKRIEQLTVREIAKSPYRNFGGKDRLPYNHLGQSVRCPPHRHTVPMCRECGAIGGFQLWCRMCRSVLNDPRYARATRCSHSMAKPKCTSCGFVGLYSTVCTDCQKTF